MTFISYGAAAQYIVLSFINNLLWQLGLRRQDDRFSIIVTSFLSEASVHLEKASSSMISL